MIYIIANTQKEGKHWANINLKTEEKFKVFSTTRQIRGHALREDDYVYILVDDREMSYVLTPALLGCRVTSCNEWIVKQKYGE